MEKRRKAAALEYRQGESAAPRVIAVGSGAVAQQIIEKARQHDIPLVEDVELVEKLVQLPVSAEIPPALYEAVAKVLALVYRLEQQLKR